MTISTPSQDVVSFTEHGDLERLQRSCSARFWSALHRALCCQGQIEALQLARSGPGRFWARKRVPTIARQADHWKIPPEFGVASFFFRGEELRGDWGEATWFCDVSMLWEIN